MILIRIGYELRQSRLSTWNSSHAKMPNIDFNCVDAIFTCRASSFISSLCETTFEHRELFHLGSSQTHNDDEGFNGPCFQTQVYWT